MQQRRVAITGIGLASGLGIGVEPFWSGMLEGRTAIAAVRQFDASSYPVPFAAEVDESFKIRNYVPKHYRKATKVMCRDIELAVAAALGAVEDASIQTKATLPASGKNASEHEETPPTYCPTRFGCQIGAGLIVADVDEISGAMASALDDPADANTFSLKNWGERGMENLTPLWLLKFLPNMLACHVTIVHDCRGPSNTITCNEVSGGLCVGEARRVIERGDAELCFAGGAESKINPLGMLRQSFVSMMAEPDATADPTTIVQPFGVNATGSLPGEGGAILIVEEVTAALERGASPYCEIIGFGAAQATDLCSGKIVPSPEGRGLQWAIEQAIADAHIAADSIDAIVPMGIGDPAHDTAELNALRTVFSERLGDIPLITSKPNIGLCAAAAGAIDIAVGALCIKHQMIPARINGDGVPDGIVANTTANRAATLRYILVCGTGLGGQSTAVILSTMDQD